MIKELQEKKPKCDIRLSYSRISKFASNGAKELNDETRTIIDNDGTSFGKLVDLIEQDVDISKEFYIFDGQKPTAMLGQLCEGVEIAFTEIPNIQDVLELTKSMGLWSSTTKEETLIAKFDKPEFWDYIKAQIESKDKKIITSEEYVLAKEKVAILRTHDFTTDIFDNQNPNIEIIDQFKLQFEYRDFNFLGFIDKLIIDHKNKTIRPIDLKTGQDSAYDFNSIFIKWKYYLQEAVYGKGLIECNPYPTYKILPFQFVYLSKFSDTPIIYEVTPEWSMAALLGFNRNGYEYKGLDSLLDDIYWHWYNNSYTLPRYLIESKGILELKPPNNE